MKFDLTHSNTPTRTPLPAASSHPFRLIASALSTRLLYTLLIAASVVQVPLFFLALACVSMYAQVSLHKFSHVRWSAHAPASPEDPGWQNVLRNGRLFVSSFIARTMELELTQKSFAKPARVHVHVSVPRPVHVLRKLWSTWDPVAELTVQWGHSNTASVIYCLTCSVIGA